MPNKREMPPAAPAAGGDTTPPHIPVMADEVRRLAAITPGAVVVDGTFGAGGHARILASDLAGVGRYIGIDRDPAAEQRFEAFAAEVSPLATRFVRATFPAAFTTLIGEGVAADVVILDVGVSSMQLDEDERGFAYSRDAPLDMRMDPSSGVSAAQLVATADEAELARILREYGEERYARRIASALVRHREVAPVARTSELVDLVLGAIPIAARYAPGGHPAKRTFQALRIAVNEELDMLDAGLDAALELLAPDGRLVVMSFHSLEDRMVKRRFEAWAGTCSCPPGLPICACGAMTRAQVLSRGAERPTPDEIERNKRATPTRLRAMRRIQPPRPVVESRGRYS